VQAKGSHMCDIKPPSLLTLGLISGVGPLTMNIITPSLPSITQEFNIAISMAQYAMTCFFIGTGFLQLFIGALSDRFGRRPVLLIAFFIFILASIICAFSPTIEWLLIGRTFQAISFAGIALARSIIRDVYPRSQAVRMNGNVTMLMAIMPLFGPIIGGYLDEYISWHASFWFTTVLSVIALIVIYYDVPETLQKTNNEIKLRLNDYKLLIQNKTYWHYVTLVSCTAAGFFTFIGGSPYIAQDIYHISPSHYGLYAICPALGYIIGNFIAAQNSDKFSLEFMQFIGALITFSSSILMFLTTGFFPNYVIGLFIPFIVLGIGNGLTLPNASIGALSVDPKLIGSAAGLMGAAQMVAGAISAAIVVYFLSPELGALPMHLAVFVVSALSLVSAYILLKQHLVQNSIESPTKEA
jgi:DHA1 family bicyclomycin/chloramphenicol resistance-like MFS transporter